MKRFEVTSGSGAHYFSTDDKKEALNRASFEIDMSGGCYVIDCKTGKNISTCFSSKLYDFFDNL